MNITLTRNQRNAINAIIAAKTRIGLDMEAVKDDVTALAGELNLRPAQVNRLVSLVMKEQGKGGIIEEENRLLEMAEQVLGGGGQSNEDEAA